MDNHPTEESAPILIGQSGDLRGRRWAITDQGLVLGRGEECDVVIADRQVSRQHAKLIRKRGCSMLEDLDSKNGTCRNGTPVKGEVELADGDVVQIALAAEFLYVASDSTLPLGFEGDALRPGRIRVNPVEHAVLFDDRQMDPPLSIHQYRLLELLLLRGGALVTREELIATVWPDEEPGGITDQAIDALVRRLRDRLKELDPERDYIVTVRGHGFRMDNSP
jgi:DNA-binding winged helix-turn-helix (wHTH) protein